MSKIISHIENIVIISLIVVIAMILLIYFEFKNGRVDIMDVIILWFFVGVYMWLFLKETLESYANAIKSFFTKNKKKNQEYSWYNRKRGNINYGDWIIYIFEFDIWISFNRVSINGHNEC